MALHYGLQLLTNPHPIPGGVAGGGMMAVPFFNIPFCDIVCIRSSRYSVHCVVRSTIHPAQLCGGFRTTFFSA